MSKYCIIIPVYNHGKELLQVLEQLIGYRLHCYIINDGSGPVTNNYIDQAIKIYKWITIITLEKNRGKGAAIKAGLRFAYDQQYTHALQMP
jgi:glycosyltransferase involved in cell wall biosynthesis